MNAQQAKAKQSEAIARASIGRLSDERLAETWMLTNGQATTRKVTILRGWLLDELELRMGRMDVMADLFTVLEHFDGDRFEAWMIAESVPGGDYVSPLPYLS